LAGEFAASPLAARIRRQSQVKSQGKRNDNYRATNQRVFAGVFTNSAPNRKRARDCFQKQHQADIRRRNKARPGGP
jgi:ribosomal protein S2